MTDRSIDCESARELLLIAEPAELRGDSDSPVGRHVRECAQCARAASRILAAQAELNHALSTLTRAGMPSRARGHRPGLVFAAVLAAAAAVALLLLPTVRNRELEPLPGPIVAVTDVPVVNAAGDDAVAVMRTSNPRITVVWYLQRER